jgi:uncharacterized damage-inducible protein DinB
MTPVTRGRRKPARKTPKGSAKTATKPSKKPSKKPAKKPAKKPGTAAPARGSVPDVERVINELERQHDGDPWHGPSRSTILADVSAAEASWQPGAGAHSIWELVLHMRSWTREVERRLLGGTPAMPADGDWPSVIDTSESAWADAQASLDASHGQLVANVRRLGTAYLSGRVGATKQQPAGTGISHRAMLYSLAQHDVYHSGQVALLKRIARAALEATD